ncbi:MAG TPA: Stk1 family PASTA domain-containing Ser/Thr kinase [Actinomycetota bacterium]|nr:Stk1 family PASTA domain-containing Ser/Thr kinase [Actinomycetota bacterium]
MNQPKKRVLAGRYQLEAPLGQGGMAKVFRATDTVLNRQVAVKVLSPQFASDEAFVARFRREAQAAAGLNHPNIVSVFDTGSQGEVHFIVMEYVEGRTLRDVIHQEGPLLPERAVEIAAAVALALAAAHEAGLVHRDVKPGNVMLTKDGEVKVMDFGIARTSTGDTLTQTATVLGTASYLSPEQAQSQPVDPRSDIYSLGCVLYEMLTGQPPFTGESPVSIAYKHVRETPVPPGRKNADVPQSIDSVVMKCLAKNPANRYETADELRQDLERLSHGMAPLAPPVLAGDPTEVVTAGEGTRVMTGPIPPDEGQGRRWLPIVAVVGVLALLGVAAFFLVRSLLPAPAQTVRVPDVVGLEEERAIEELERVRLEAIVEERRFDEEVERGEVLEQDPADGTMVEQGARVNLVVSKGPKPVEVPDLTGLTEDGAADALAEAGLILGGVEERDSLEEEGTVIEQDPPQGTRVDPESEVDIVLSSGPATVTVPNVICVDVDEAQGEITAAGLQFDVVGSGFSDECPEGTVSDQEPEGGSEVPEGSTVRVLQSRGPEPIPTPTPTPPVPTF